jgi:hypothetical protein
MALLGIIVIGGCHGSRWARRDADYRAKYDQHRDQPLQVVKQAIDARHVRGKSGGYGAIVGVDQPAAGGVEVGAFHYGTPYAEGRVGVAAMIREGDHPLMAGANLGFRLQTPTRLAPFVGATTYAGWTGTKQADDDGRDNDDDGWIDEVGETDDTYTVAIAPELGMHFWLDHKRRVTFSSRYFVSAYGRDEDFLYFGIEYGSFGDAYERERSCPPAECAEAMTLNYIDDFPAFAPSEEWVPPNPYEQLILAPSPGE